MSKHYFKTHQESTNVRVFNPRQLLTRTLLGLVSTVAPQLTQRLIIGKFCSPAAYSTNVEEENCVRQGKPFQVQVRDKTIQAWRWGQGPAVLMVHGWSGRGAQFHRFIRPFVKAGYTVIAIDCPAHGASSGRITNYFEFTDTIRTLLVGSDRLDIRGIIGHSFGASAAINALAKERIEMALVGIAPILGLRELLLNTFERYGIPRAVYTGLISELETRFGYSLEKDDPQRLLNDLGGLFLIVHDERDRTTPFSDSVRQANIHPHITLFRTKGLGHWQVLMDDAVVQAALGHFEFSGLASHPRKS